MKPFLYSMITLASGIIIGAAATAMILHKPVKPDRPRNWEWISERIVNRMVRELSLTPEQKEMIYPIIKKHFENIDQIREDARPQIQSEIEGMNDELLAVFDENQKRHYQENIRRMGEGFPGMSRRRGSGGPGQRGPGQRGPGSGQQRPDPDQRGSRFRERDGIPPQGMEGNGFRRGDGRRRPQPIDPNQPPPQIR